jgi:two-component system, OmpR family, sensor histidine kinase VicK
LKITKKRKMNRTKKKISIRYNEDPIIEADKGRITQVISNLLSNAIKFTAEEGEVSINVKRDNIAKQIVVNIIDNGQGIHPKIFPRLFTKFATDSVVGTGLGLFISKKIVEAHGGKIWAQNNVNGKGATFTFTLPLSTTHQKLRRNKNDTITTASL